MDLVGLALQVLLGRLPPPPGLLSLLRLPPLLLLLPAQVLELPLEVLLPPAPVPELPLGVLLLAALRPLPEGAGLELLAAVHLLLRWLLADLRSERFLRLRLRRPEAPPLLPLPPV